MNAVAPQVAGQDYVRQAPIPAGAGRLRQEEPACPMGGADRVPARPGPPMTGMIFHE
jgi:hypothetical protein